MVIAVARFATEKLASAGGKERKLGEWPVGTLFGKETIMAVTPIEKPFVTAQYYGDSGGSTQYWYWVQAVYAMGFGPLSTNLASVTVLSLSHSNVVSINWTPCSSAMYYNVWRTTTSSAPTAGTGQCIAQGLATADGLVDNGLPTFTIAVGTPPSLLAEGEAAAKKAEEADKKAAEESRKEADKLIAELEKTQKEDDEQAVKDAQRAKKLDDLYRENFAPGVRATDAQKKAAEEAVATTAKVHGGEKVTHVEPGEKKPPASPEKK